MEDDTRAKSKEPVDAAALIADALKRKFAHRYRQNSVQDDKDDFSLPVKEAKPVTDAPLVRDVGFRAGGSVLEEKTQPAVFLRVFGMQCFSSPFFCDVFTVWAAHAESNWKEKDALNKRT